ncbi:MAG TPA: hypothetical protein VFR02_05820, partial [bacterium]|nr:hypothetical protein [bacterium]
GFIPHATPTPVFTLTPTGTSTPTVTSTVTATPTETPTNNGGFTSTWTASPTETETPQLQDTDTPTETPSPTPTASGDAYGSWQEAVDVAGFPGKGGLRSLWFNNRLWALGGYYSNGSIFQLDNSVWSSPDGVQWAQESPKASFPGRADFGAVVFDPSTGSNNSGRMWVLGGLGLTDSLNDVWSSTDGVHWLQVAATTPWSPRWGLTATVFQGQIWVIGGVDEGNNALSDAWHSPDGVNWTQAPAPPFAARGGHQTLVYGGQLWVLGGQGTGARSLNDVWSSPDGTTWTEQTSAAEWPAREFFCAQVLDGQMVVASGETNDGRFLADLGDVFHSGDGIHWTRSTYEAPFGVRSQAACASDGSRIWILGGETPASSKNLLSDVWYSNGPGIPSPTPTPTPTPDELGQWTRVNPDAGFIPRDNPALASFNGRLWMAGGTNDFIGPVGDVWSSADGVNWSLAAQESIFEEQDDPILLSLNGKLWALNMVDWSTNSQAVYSSPDGINWTETTQAAPYGAPQEAYSFGGKLWIVDYTQNLQAGTSRVYSSADGANWAMVGTTPGGGRQGAAYTVFNGKMWIFGGTNPQNNTTYYEVLNSTDGATWNEVSNQTPMTILRDYDVVATSDRIYLIRKDGGDQWSTPDGIHWTQVAGPPAFAPRSNFSTTAYNQRFWILGGGDTNGDQSSDIWTAPGNDSGLSTWTPTPSPTSTWTPTPTGTISLTPQPTATPTPSLTWTPVPTPTIPQVSGRDWAPSLRPNPVFSKRKYEASAWFKDQLWVIGGDSGSGPLADTWSSPDGSNWGAVTTQAPWGAEEGQAAVSFQGQLWVMGGNNGQSDINGIWNTLDGQTWTMGSPVPWTARSFFPAVVFNGQLWVLGGSGKIDVWSSADGSTWIRQPDGPFTGNGGQAVVFNGRIWFIGAGQAGAPGAIWSTSDGISWDEPVTVEPFESRTGFTATVADGRIWVLGGKAASSGLKSDVWYSCDGVNWHEATAQAAFSPRQGLLALPFQPDPGTNSDALWVLGGLDYSNQSNGNAWYTPLLGHDQPCYAPTPTPTPTPLSGAYSVWNLGTGQAAFAPRADQGAAVFD